jgi:hypothetical protein
MTMMMMIKKFVCEKNIYCLLHSLMMVATIDFFDFNFYLNINTHDFLRKNRRDNDQRLR